MVITAPIRSEQGIRRTGDNNNDNNNKTCHDIHTVTAVDSDLESTAVDLPGESCQSPAGSFNSAENHGSAVTARYGTRRSAIIRSHWPVVTDASSWPSS